MNFINRINSRQIFLLLLLCITLSAGAQTVNPKYNKTLADSLSADEFGMKMYVLVMLKAGSNNTSDKAATDSLFAGHLKNIRRLADVGKLAVAGPLETNNKGYRGIFILNSKTTEEARSLLETDPAIKAKLLDFDLYGWYGSAALPMYLPFSKMIEKKSF